MVLEGLTDTVLLNDLDHGVYTFWKTALSKEGNEYMQREIRSFKDANVQLKLERLADNERELAFQYLLRNRLSRGGIVAPGSGFLLRGEASKGRLSRWYPETLCERLEWIKQKRSCFSVSNVNAMELLNSTREEATWFLDPPYTAGSNGPGRRLYKEHDFDHFALIRRLGTLGSPWILTEHDTPLIRVAAREAGLIPREFVVKNAHHVDTKELVFLSNHFQV